MLVVQCSIFKWQILQKNFHLFQTHTKWYLLQNSTLTLASVPHHETEIWTQCNTFSVSKFSGSCCFFLLPSFAIASSKPATLHSWGFLRLLPWAIGAFLLPILRSHDLTSTAVHFFWLQRGGKTKDGILSPDETQWENLSLSEEIWCVCLSMGKMIQKSVVFDKI